MKSLLLSAVLMISFSSIGVNQIDSNEDVVLFFQEKQYKKVETGQIPALILKQASVRYSGFALNEAYVADDAEYKLVLSKDKKAINAYYKSNGEFIKEEAKS